MAHAFTGFEVLNGNRQAVEGAELVAAHDRGFGGAGGIEGSVAVDGEVGVDEGIDRFDAVEDGPGQLNG